MRPEKESIVNEVKERLDGAAFTILLDCRGMTVEQLEDLRVKLDRSHTKVAFTRNTLLKVAFNDCDLGGLGDYCSGPTALVAGDSDMARAAKIVSDFSKENDLPHFKGGSIDRQVYDAEQVLQIANLPTREVLLGQAVGTIAAPMTQMVGVLQQKIMTLFYALLAVKEKKGGE